MNWIVKIYVVVTAALLADLALYLFYTISLPGHIADLTLFWVWFIMTFIVVLKNIKKTWARGYAIFLVVLTILSMLPMMLPFLAILIFATGSYMDDEAFIINDRLRVEESRIGALALPKVVATENYVFFEKEIGETRAEFQIDEDYFRLADVVEIHQAGAEETDSLRLQFKFRTGTVSRTMIERR